MSRAARDFNNLPAEANARSYMKNVSLRDAESGAAPSLAGGSHRFNLF